MTNQQLLNLITAPFRFALESIQAVFMATVAVIAIIGYPFYLLLTHQPVTLDAWGNAGLVLTFLVAFFYAPIFTVIMTLPSAFFGLYLDTSHPAFHQFWTNHGRWLIFGFCIVAILQKLLRRYVLWPLLSAWENHSLERSQAAGAAWLSANNFSPAARFDQEIARLMAVSTPPMAPHTPRRTTSQKPQQPEMLPWVYDSRDDCSLRPYTQLQKHQPPFSEALEIEEMPLQKDAECFAATIAELNERVTLLHQRIAAEGLANRNDVRLAVEDALAGLQDAVNRLQRLIRRFEHEVPSFSRSELESLLATCEVQRTRLIDVAVRAELIEA